MDVSSKPVELHVALAYIGKVHGLTPHASTDRCPFELVKQSNLPSLFPNLTSNVQKKSELTAVRHSATRLRNRRNFDEGDRVVVYDNHTKLSYPAVVSEILGTNNYLVNSENGSKHVSGDVMSRVAATVPTVPAATTDLDRNNPSAEDDNISVISEASGFSGFPDIYAPHIGGDIIPVQRRGRGQREIANLGNTPQLPRLRSGRF